jgi:hypothetical protein
MSEGTYRFRNGYEVAFDDVADLGTVEMPSMSDMLDLPPDEIRIGFELHLKDRTETVKIDYTLDGLLGEGSCAEALRFTQEKSGHLDPSHIRALAAAQLVPEAYDLVVADWSGYAMAALQHHDTAIGLLADACS